MIGVEAEQDIKEAMSKRERMRLGMNWEHLALHIGSTYPLPVFARIYPQVRCPDLKLKFPCQENRTGRFTTSKIKYSRTCLEIYHLRERLCQPEHVRSHQVFEHPDRIIGSRTGKILDCEHRGKFCFRIVHFISFLQL